MDLGLGVIQKSILSFYRFWEQKSENQYFQCRFYQTEVHVVTNWSSRLEKTHQTLEILCLADFLSSF